MKGFCIWLILVAAIITNFLSVTAVAQNSDLETKKRFEGSRLGCSENGTTNVYKTPDGKIVWAVYERLKTVEETKNKIEKIVSEASEILESNTYFSKFENQTAGRYVLRFDESKDGKINYKIVIYSNERIQIFETTTLELVLEFEKFQITQK